MEPSKAREWWIFKGKSQLTDCIVIGEPSGPHSSEYVHVIEYSAYEMVCAELDKLQRSDCEFREMCLDERPALKEIDTLRAENDKLKAQLWVAKDSALRTYDGLAEKADKYDEVCAQLAVAQAKLKQWEIDASEGQGCIEELEIKLSAVTKERDEALFKFNLLNAHEKSRLKAIIERDAALARAEGAEKELKAAYCVHDKHPLEECEECWNSNKTLTRRIAALQSHADKLAEALETLLEMNYGEYALLEPQCDGYDEAQALAAYRERGTA